MHVCDYVDLDRRCRAKFTNGVRSTCGIVSRRLAVLHEHQPVIERDAQLQSSTGGRPVPHTAVHYDLGIFWHRFRLVGLVSSRKRTVPERFEPDEKQKTSEYI